MKVFGKLNLFAFLYGFVLFLQAELIVNLDRTQAIAPWYNDTINNILQILIFLISTVIFFYMTAKYFHKGRLKYLLSILWIPYCLALVYLFAALFPFSNSDDASTPGDGLLLAAVLIFYPLYIAIINVIGSVIKINSAKTTGS